MAWDSAQSNAVGSSIGGLGDIFGAGFSFKAWKSQWEDLLAQGNASLDQLRAGWGEQTDNLSTQAGAADAASETRATAVIVVFVVVFSAVVGFVIYKNRK